MGLESATYISSLVSTNPDGAADPKSKGDDHLRLLKAVLKATFPDATKAFYFPKTLAKTADYTILQTDDNTLVLVDATSAAVTITLPAVASTPAGFTLAVKKTDASANAVTIDGNASETIDGATTLVLSARYAVAVIRCDGTEWHVMNLLPSSLAYVAVADLASTATGKGAALVGVEDSAGNFTGTDLESVLAELAGPAAAVPVGGLLSYAGATAPSGWLLCYGQAVSRTTYSALFTAISTAYGTGDGSTTFNVPDLRGRATFGKDNMGGSAASRLTSAVSGVDGATLGAAGGDQRMQAHTHALSLGTAVGLVGGSLNTIDSTASGLSTQSTGAGTSQNMPPAIVVNWIIYTGV